MERRLPWLALLAAIGRPVTGLWRTEPLPFTEVTGQSLVTDDGAVHVAATACRSCDYIAALTRSIAAQARLEGGVKPVLHLFVDALCRRHVRNLGLDEPGTLEAIDARAYDVMNIAGMPTDPTPHGKRCTMVRLFIPRFFPRLQRLLYLDADSVVLGSLRPLWDMPVPVIALAENDVNFHGTVFNHVPTAESFERCPTWRNGTKALFKSSVLGDQPRCWVGDHGLNAGVLLFNLTGWRAYDLDREVDYWSDHFLRGEIDMLMNDQDILNMILVQHQDYYTSLPCEANLQFSHRWMCLFTPEGSWASWDTKGKGVLKRNKRRPLVIHSKFGEGTLRQQWRYLYNRTNHFAWLVNVQGLRNGSSLCSVIDCDRLVLEEEYVCASCKPGFKYKTPCVCKELRFFFVEDQTYPHFV